MFNKDFVGHSTEGDPPARRGTSGPTTLDQTPPPAPAHAEAALASLLKDLWALAQVRPATRPANMVPPWKEVARAKGRPSYFRAKHLLDVALAVLGLVIASPLLLITWVLVRLTSPGPALFRQERVGFRGRRFVVYKFRTMYVDNDEHLHRAAYEQFLRGERSHGKVDQATAPAAGQAPKPRRSGVARDPRVTPLGYLLRRSSIDELPQLINVLRGEMSIVGPRPPIPYEVSMYQAWHLGRLETLPGITGLWQVQGRSRVSFDKMVQMDREYIEKQSFWYDVKLILLTIPAVLSRRGAC